MDIYSCDNNKDMYYTIKTKTDKILIEIGRTIDKKHTIE